MTRTSFLLTGEQAHGTTATAANTGFATIQTGTGGTAVWSDAAGYSGSAGVRLTVGTGNSYVRAPFAAAATSFRASIPLALPSIVPTATLPVVDFFSAGDVRAFSIVWTTTKQLILRRNPGSTTGQVILFAADALASGQRIRIEFVEFTIGTTGTYTIEVYNANTNTLLGTAQTGTGWDSGTNPVTYVNVGSVSTTAGATGSFTDTDNIQLDDSPGARIGAYWPAGVTPALPERESSNVGGWTSVGGAASSVVAVRDSSDSTYVQAPGTVAGETMEFRMAVPSSGDFKAVIRASASDTTGVLKLDMIELDNTIRATRTQTLTTTATTYEFIFTGAENASVVNRNGLRFRLTANPAV